jgi:hypothetical protein
METKDPKGLVASSKPDLSLVTGPMLVGLAAALANGEKKYGRLNWRTSGGIRALVYTAAALRHIKAWEDGEDVAPDSGVHHLDHALASLAILRDAAAAGTLVDNRGSALPAPAKKEPGADMKKYIFEEGSNGPVSIAASDVEEVQILANGDVYVTLRSCGAFAEFSAEDGLRWYIVDGDDGEAAHAG